MKKILYLFSIFGIMGLLSCNQKQDSPLVGTWKMVSSEYTLANGQPDTGVHAVAAVRVYNNTHFAAYYEYKDSSTLTGVASYLLSGKELTVNILYHTSPEFVGRSFKGESFVRGDTLTHMINADGYRILEKYIKMK